ncbi:MAG: hypothetical protein V2A73_17995, partial [Pseudomonadota bacterium]
MAVATSVKALRVILAGGEEGRRGGLEARKRRIKRPPQNDLSKISALRRPHGKERGGRILSVCSGG